MDEMLKVFVTNIIDPSMFWARIGFDVDLEAEQNLEDVISEYVSHLPDYSKFQDIKLASNQIILAKSNEHGGRWLRATAVSRSSSRVSSEIDVVFTGYGSNELVGWSDIIISVPDYVCEWKNSAECCRLDGIEPVGDSWSIESLEYFSNCVLKRRLSCKRTTCGQLTIYTGKGKRDTIQDCLIRKGFAKRSSEEVTVVTPSMMNGHPSTTMAAATGGIPEFDTIGLFFRSDSPASPSEEETQPARDFEMELHRNGLDISGAGLPTHSDYLYCGRRPANGLFGPKSEPYAKKVSDIKEELARFSRANRQLVRHNDWRNASSHPWANRSATDPRNGCKSSKLLENDKDDWRLPKASRSLNSPNDDIRKQRSTSEPESFKEDLCQHLNRNSSQDVILAFLRPILKEDDLLLRRLFSCLTAIVDRMLESDALMVRCLDLLESLKSENKFYEHLAHVIVQCHTDCVQIADFELLKSRLESFTELLAQLLLRFPDESQIVDCALKIADFWIASKIKSADVSNVQTLFASCLKNFICIVGNHSVRLVRLKLFRLLDVVREMLVSDSQPRSVREIWLNLLLYVEQKKTENRMTSNDTFNQIANHSQSKPNGSIDSNDISSIASAASPALSSTSHSSFHSAGAAPLTENRVTPLADYSSPLFNGTSSLSEGRQDLLLTTPGGDESKLSESKSSTRGKSSKKKAQKKMSLQSFYATPASPVSLERTPDRAVFREDFSCVTCGSQYHMTADCPDRSSKFIL